MSKKPLSSRECTRRAGLLGNEVRHEYIQLREGYKGKGLSAKEACERATIELKIHEQFEDYRRRRVQSELMGAGVPLTPDEMKEVHPEYERPTPTKAEEIGEEILSFAEEVLWARDQRAMVENGSDPPVRFPNKGALSWYQYAVSNRSEFMKLVAKVASPAGATEDWIFQDGQHQFSEVEKQIREALTEVGDGLVEAESGFVEILQGGPA